MPLEKTSDSAGILLYTQTDELSQTDPVRSIEMDYSKWPVTIAINMIANNHIEIIKIDTNVNDPEQKMKGRESPTCLVFPDVDNFEDAVKMFKLTSVTQVIIEELSKKYEIAKSKRPASPRPT